MNWWHIINNLKQEGFSHAQQGMEAGVDRKTVENWANGRCEPLYTKAEALLSVYRTVVGSTE